MKIQVYRFKTIILTLAAVVVSAMILLSPASITTSAKSDDFDAAGLYKAKCAMCHGAKAEKKFDATLTDDQLVAAIMSGKKGVKPPNMPEFQSKGVTAEQSTSLVTYMKSIR